jgi:modulator of FtsH protease HflK
MPWKDQTEGSGDGSEQGSKGQSNHSDPHKGPWGEPPRQSNGGGGDRGPGQTPPDLEELLKSGRERFRRAAGRGGRGLGGGSGLAGMPPRNLFIIGALVLLGFWAFSGIYRVENNEQAVVTTFGEFTDVAGPGLQWHVPWPVQDVTVVAVTLERSTDIGGTEERQTADGLMLTSDLNIVAIGIKVNWRIKQSGYEEGEFPDVAKYVLRIENPEALVRAVAESALREIVGANDLDPVISDQRDNIALEIKDRIQLTLDLYDSGIEIRRVNLGHAGPTPEVKPAFDDVIDARSEAQETINIARGYANKIIPEARGEAQRMILNAEAYASRVVAEARGEASRFIAIYTEYAKAPEVTRQRMYLETVEKVLSGTNKIIMDSDSDGAGTVPYINVNELTRRSGE